MVEVQIGRMVEVQIGARLYQRHGRRRHVVVAVIVVWRRNMKKKEMESGERVSQRGAGQQCCVLPTTTFRAFPSARTDPTGVAAS
jgi:hypothetical protein